MWGILIPEDVADLGMPPEPDPDRNIPRRYALVQGLALMPGDPVVAVIADSPELARDAAELVEVDYEPLDIVGGVEAAIAAAPIHAGQLSNVAYERGRGDFEAVARMSGPIVIEGLVDHPRVVPAPIEGRVAIADWRDGGLTV